MIDFIGIGAQKSGTSWVYACLYEHPEICAPVKEIHFFSRPRFERGVEWYESHFKNCDERKKKGEFSTSYLYSKEAPERIKENYPDVKLIAIVRNPVDRAVSQYKNAIKAGEIGKQESFSTYCKREESVIAQGLYAEQLKRYLALFKKEQLLVLVYEESKKNPLLFIKKIYEFLDIDSTFIPLMLYNDINIARVPKVVFIDRVMHRLAESMRKIGLDGLVHWVRTKGLPDIVRRANTEVQKSEVAIDTQHLRSLFIDDAKELSKFLGRDMLIEWNLL